MSEFKREERFIVIKRKHLSAESRTHDSLEQELRIWLDRHLVPTSECVVVESDWPEYETVWAMLAARIEGRATPYQLLEQQVAALRQHKNDYMEAAEGTRLALEAEAQALRDQVKALQSDANSWQSGYDKGRHDGTKHRQSEVEQLTRDVEELRARVVVPDGYALVPVEPTREMFIAVNKEDDKAYAGGCDHGAQFDWLWTAALEAAPRLNGKAVSEGLLRLCAQMLGFYVEHLVDVSAEPEDISLASGAREELRALLDDGKEDADA